MSRTTRRTFLIRTGSIGAGLWARNMSISAALQTASSSRPNIILFLGDDLGHSDLGCYGQQKIRTPAIDALAREGVRFTQCYSGSPVCAPSRCVLMTGKHAGHAFVRDNHEIQPEGQLPIPASTITLPKILRNEGYVTGAVGKWGLGPPDSEGDPNRQGFDLFFGYNCQRHAHNHYPAYLWRNDAKITIEGNDGASPTGKQYAPDLFESETMNFIRANRNRAFFLFFATTVPHLALQVPEDSLAEYRGRWDDPPYDGKDGYQPQQYPRAAYAAMVTRMDRSVGRIMALLKELGLDNNTLVLFSSDNGASFAAAGFDGAFFKGTGPFRASKGSIYEGGIRVPLIARWPGRIKAGGTSGHVTAFQDMLPTILDTAGSKDRIPADSDGLTFLPTLTGSGRQAEHSYLYMEFAGYGGQVMVRMGNWKGVRKDLLKNPAAPVELYDLAQDIAEKNDLAARRPDIVKKIAAIIRAEHRPSKEFPIPALDNP
jgi:arylsulfatase A